ncbi:hypothetical protein QQF64_035431, partial [Cirrhinus molitorella]
TQGCGAAVLPGEPWDFTSSLRDQRKSTQIKHPDPVHLSRRVVFLRDTWTKPYTALAGITGKSSAIPASLSARYCDLSPFHSHSNPAGIRARFPPIISNSIVPASNRSRMLSVSPFSSARN